MVRRVWSGLVLGLVLVVGVLVGPGATPAEALCTGSSLCSVAGPNAWMLSEFAGSSSAAASSVAASGATVAELGTAAVSAAPVASGSVASAASGLGLRAVLGKFGQVLNLASTASTVYSLFDDGSALESAVPVVAAVPGWVGGVNTIKWSCGATSTVSVTTPNYDVSGSITVTITSAGSSSCDTAYGMNVDWTRGSDNKSYRLGTIWLSADNKNGTTYVQNWSVPWMFRSLTIGGPAGDLVYWAPGAPDRPGGGGDVEGTSRTVTRTLTCTNAAGETWQGSVTSPTFTLAELRSGASVTVPEVSCPTNMWAVQSDTKLVTGTGTSATETDLGSASTPAEVAERAAGILSGTDAGLQLWYVGSGSEIDCFGSDTLCKGWSVSPTRDVEFRCTDGGVTVPLDECIIYRDIPNGDVTPTADAAPSDPEASECWPNGWGMLNPAEWVYRPINCALRWAFVPAEGLDTSPVRAAFDGSVFGAIATATASVGDAFAGLGDVGDTCGAIVDDDIPIMDQHVVVSTCDWPWSSMGAVRNVLGIGFIVGAAVVGLRTILGTIRVDVKA